MRFTIVPAAATTRSARSDERWLLVSSVGTSPRAKATSPCPTPSCSSVASAEAITAMLTTVSVSCRPGPASDVRILSCVRLPLSGHRCATAPTQIPADRHLEVEVMS